MKAGNLPRPTLFFLFLSEEGYARVSMLKPSLAVLPAASVAVHSTSVLPTGNVVLGGRVQSIAISPPTSSCERPFPSSVAVPSTSYSAVTANVTSAPSALIAVTTMSSGTVTVGGVVSGGGFTLTVNDAVPILPAASVADAGSDLEDLSDSFDDISDATGEGVDAVE